MLVVFLGFVGIVVAIALFSTLSLFIAPPVGTPMVSTQKLRMSLTQFDRELAIEMMDNNDDGKCDACGMAVELCIDSGQLQCNMDSKSIIGVLDSQHIHADFKIYVNGQVLNLSDKDHMGRMRKSLSVSSFIHVDSGAPAPERTGDVLHMHATGVPLWILFESVGWKFNKDCLILDGNEKYCNDDKNILKFYINGKPNNEWENYVFKDLDKILISYGSETDLASQLSSITNFAKNH